MRRALLLLVTLVAFPACASDLSSVVKTVMPSVVSVMVQTPQGFSGGSAFFINKRGHLITCAHVVDDAGVVLLRLGEAVSIATVIAKDDALDLAILHMEIPTIEARPVRIRGSRMRLGETVFAVGTPLGLPGSVSHGIVSGFNRGPRSFLQTDAPINPGNSGGPLFDKHGRVVGVNAARFLNSDGMGFAVPAHTLLKFIRKYTVGVR